MSYMLYKGEDTKKRFDDGDKTYELTLKEISSG